MVQDVDLTAGSEEQYTDAELTEIRHHLTGRADELRAELEQAEAELNGVPEEGGDEVDLGADAASRAHGLHMARHASDLLSQTELALERLADGTYGLCTVCGQQIGKARMEAFPRATQCMECKARDELRTS